MRFNNIDQAIAHVERLVHDHQRKQLTAMITDDCDPDGIAAPEEANAVTTRDFLIEMERELREAFRVNGGTIALNFAGVRRRSRSERR